MFKMYSNPEVTGWLGWFEDANGKATAYVGLNRKVKFAHELDNQPPLEAPVPCGCSDPLGRSFEKALSDAINRHSMENGSDTPDYILGRYLANCLDALDLAIVARSNAERPPQSRV